MDLNKEFCMNLLKEYTQSESLLKHAFAVEACVSAYAVKYNANLDLWSNVALLHDFDYEKYPGADEHPYRGAEILKTKGFSEEFVDAVLSHADYTNIPRDTLLKKVLYACDELAGFLTAVAYVRPNKTIEEVEVKSVIKKMKDKAFSKAINRDDIKKGAELLDIPLEEHIEFCIEALKKKKEVLGL